MANQKEEENKDMLKLKELGMDAPIPVTEENKHRNDGKWCKIFREAQKVKQYTIGQELDGITQQAVSKIENRTLLPDHILEVYARLCRVEVEMIKNMPEVKDGMNNMFHDQSQQLNAEQHIHNVTFNPIDKVVELCKDKDDLHEEIIRIEREQKEELKKMLDEARSFTVTLAEQLKGKDSAK